MNVICVQLLKKIIQHIMYKLINIFLFSVANELPLEQGTHTSLQSYQNTLNWTFEVKLFRCFRWLYHCICYLEKRHRAAKTYSSWSATLYLSIHSWYCLNTIKLLLLRYLTQILVDTFYSYILVRNLPIDSENWGRND